MTRRSVTIMASDGKKEDISWYDGATEAAILRCARLALGLGLDPDRDLDPEERARLVWKTGEVVDFGQPVTDGVTLYLDTTIAPPRDNVYGGYGGSDGYDGYDSYGGYTGSLNTPGFPFGEGRGGGGGGRGGGDVAVRGRSSAGRVRSRTRDQDQERSGWEEGRSSRSVPASSSSPAAVCGSGGVSASGSGGGSGNGGGGNNRRRSDSRSDAPKTLIRRWLRRRLDSSSRDGSGGGGSGSGTGFNPPVDRNSSDEERRPLLSAATRSPPSRRDQPANADKGGWDWDWGWGWCGGGGGEQSRPSSLSPLLSGGRGGEREEAGPHGVDGNGGDGEQQRRAILKIKRVNAHLANERTFLAWVRATGKMFTSGVLSLALAVETNGSYAVLFVTVSLVYFALCPYIVFLANNRYHKVADVMQGSVHDAYAFFTGRHVWGITVLLSVLAGLTLAVMSTELMAD